MYKYIAIVKISSKTQDTTYTTPTSVFKFIFCYVRAAPVLTHLDGSHGNTRGNTVYYLRPNCDSGQLIYISSLGTTLQEQTERELSRKDY